MGTNGKLERFHGLSPLLTYIHTYIHYIWPNMNPLREITLGLVWTSIRVLDPTCRQYMGIEYWYEYMY